MNRFILLALIVFSLACSQQKQSAQEIVNNSIQTYGCDILNASTITFDFRKHKYSLSKKASSYVYKRSLTDSTGVTVDSLFNSTRLIRYINGVKVQMSEKESSSFANSVNSVLYFFQIPCVLNDPAVIKNLTGTATIEGNTYHQVEIRFKAEGGGEDFEDVYMYWINEESFTVDYLAYNYHVEGGGTRFRKAINRRVIEGLTVQDYVNFKPEAKLPPLESLPALYENGQLQELSRIINENVVVNKL
jgi:hypothetical protein